MPKVINVPEGDDKQKLHDLILQAQLISKQSEPHLRALKEIEAEVGLVNMKMAHVVQELYPESKDFFNVSYNYNESNGNIEIKMMTKKEHMMSTMPDNIPEEIKRMLVAMLGDKESES